MKALFVMVPVLMVSAAQAGPHPTEKVTVLLEARTSGGMPGPNPNACRSYEIRLMSDGSVVQSECDKKTVTTAILPKPQVSAVKVIIEEATPGKLVPAEPDAPECMDAPSTVYTAIKANGKKIEIAARVNCRELGPENQDYDSASLASVLSSLDDLSMSLSTLSPKPIQFK